MGVIVLFWNAVIVVMVYTILVCDALVVMFFQRPVSGDDDSQPHGHVDTEQELGNAEGAHDGNRLLHTHISGNEFMDS